MMKKMYGFNQIVSGTVFFVALLMGQAAADSTSTTGLSYVGSVLWSGKISEIQISGDNICFAMPFGIVLVNMNNPAVPVKVGQLYLPHGNAHGMDIAGNYAYVADGSNGLCIVDIADPKTPSTISTWRDANNAMDVAITGAYAYVGDSVAGLQIIDISNPQIPSLVGSCRIPGTPRAVAISGNYAFIASGKKGLQIADISNPSAPTLVGKFDTPGYARRISLSGANALVADSTKGVQIVDVTDPRKPRKMGQYDTKNSMCDVSVSSSVAFIAADNGLHVIDIANPSRPIPVGIFGTAVSALSVSNDRLYAGDIHLRVLDITDPKSPDLLGRYANVEGSKEWRDIIASENSLYLVSSDGLKLFDISDLNSARFVGSYDSFALHMAIAGQYAYLVGIDDLDIVDLADPTSPRKVAYFKNSYSFYGGVAVSDGYIFLSSSESGLYSINTGGYLMRPPFQVVDFHDPGIKPRLADVYQSRQPGRVLDVRGNYAYVTLQNGAPDSDRDYLMIADVSDPYAIHVTSGITLPRKWSKDIVVTGNLAIVLFNEEIDIIDVTEPKNPRNLAKCKIANHANNIIVDGSFIYVATDSTGLQVVDISVPSNPRLVSTYNTSSPIRCVTSDRHHIYVAEDNGILILSNSVANTDSK